jgi:hypothetical protein
MITLTLDKQQLTLSRPGATQIVVSHDAPALAQAIGQLARWPPTQPGQAAATVATPAQLGQRLAMARALRLAAETR